MGGKLGALVALKNWSRFSTTTTKQFRFQKKGMGYEQPKEQIDRPVVGPESGAAVRRRDRAGPNGAAAISKSHRQDLQDRADTGDNRDERLGHDSVQRHQDR